MTTDIPTRDTEMAEPATLSWRILEAVRYLEQCRRTSRLFAVVTGEARGEVRLAADRFLERTVPALRVARPPAPSDSSHVFLEAILVDLGFEPFESTSDDLLRLLTVVLRQGSEQQDPVCIVIDQAQEYGPRVFETLCELARNVADLARPPLLLLTGNAALLRVLDSRGMAAVAVLTRQRFELAAVTAPPAVAPEVPPATPELVLSLGQDVVQRFPLGQGRVLIGRGPHCDLCIRSRFVSRQHALLIRNNDGDWLLDLKSTNGTSINSRTMSRRRLRHGDVISIGNHRLQYLNPAGRWPQREGVPAGDQLSETVVMRSLLAMSAPEASVAKPGSSTSVA